MRKVVLAGVTLLGLLSGARAENLSFRPWINSYNVAARGTPVCSMGAVVTNRGVGQNVMVKMFRGSQHINVTLYKDTWNVPRGSDVPVMLDFGNNEPAQFTAYGDGHIIDVELPTGDTLEFLSRLRDRPFMQIIFPGGSEPTWIVRAEGVRPALLKLIECQRRMSSQPVGGAVTQPHSR